MPIKVKQRNEIVSFMTIPFSLVYPIADRAVFLSPNG